MASAPLPVLPKAGPWKPTDLFLADTTLARHPVNSSEPSNDSSLLAGFATWGFRNHSFSGLLRRGYIYRRAGQLSAQVLPDLSA